MRTSILIVLSIAGLSPAFAAEQRVTAAEFSAKAFAALPVEEQGAFVKALEADRQPLLRAPSARASAGEMAIADQGWTVIYPAAASPALREAAVHLRDFMQQAMRVAIVLQPKESLSGWAGLRNAIIAGTREQLGGCGAELRDRKDYQLTVSPECVLVCGYDERGAMYGLYNLEERASLRQGPFLPARLNTVRHSLYRMRMTPSGIGWMEFPDRYLQEIARYGLDSLYASEYANPNGAPGATTAFAETYRRQDPGRMRDLINRAARYGLDIYTPIRYRYTGDPENDAGLRDLMRDILHRFPDIRGYVLLTEGFFYLEHRSWKSAHGHGQISVREWARNWSRGIQSVIDECRKVNPSIEVLPWDYSIGFGPMFVEEKKDVVRELPLDSIPLFTFENGKGFERDGEKGWLRDYSINEVGPAETTAAQIALARERGFRHIYTKADTWASWQYGTFPYLPFPEQWYARYQALEKSGVDGVMEAWSYGFQPNFVAEMRAWYSWSDAPPLEDLLRSIARRDFGAGSEDLVLNAWKHFSDAIRLVPDTGPNWGTNNAVAAPFFFDKPKPRMMTRAHSWNNGIARMGEQIINPYWPYTDQRLILFPDFSNQTNAAENYVRPFTLPVFQKYLLLAADEMEQGLQTYRAAALNAPESRRNAAFQEVLLAEQIQRMMRSEHALLEFEDLRFHLFHTQDGGEKRRTLDRMAAIARDEIRRTTAALETARRDSRLGHQWENDYIYTTQDIQEKLKLLRAVADEQIPAYRRSNQL